MSRRMPRDFKSNHSPNSMNVYSKYQIETPKPIEITKELIEKLRYLHELEQQEKAKKY